MEQFCFTQKLTLSEGLDALQKSHFHLVLLNLSLPDASAADSITKILEVAPDLPVIALVSKGETAKTAEALRLGVDDYLLQAIAYALLRPGANEFHQDNSLLDTPHHSKTSK